MLTTPHAIHPYELSNQQLTRLHRFHKGLIISAWRTASGVVVYLDGKSLQGYFCRYVDWVVYDPEKHH